MMIDDTNSGVRVCEGITVIDNAMYHDRVDVFFIAVLQVFIRVFVRAEDVGWLREDLVRTFMIVESIRSGCCIKRYIRDVIRCNLFRCKVINLQKEIYFYDLIRRLLRLEQGTTSTPKWRKLHRFCTGKASELKIKT